MTQYTIRPPRREEFQAWYALYLPYSILMEDEVTQEVAQTVWTWIHDDDHPTEAIVALAGSRMVGFAHFRPFPRTLHANDAGFLDDLYVAEEERNSGLGQTLIEELCAIAQRRGWSHVRWVAAGLNAGAQRLYERVAERMDLVTYRRPAG